MSLRMAALMMPKTGAGDGSSIQDGVSIRQVSSVPVPVEVLQDRPDILAESGGPRLDLPVGVHVDRADVDVCARQPVDRSPGRRHPDNLRAQLRAPGLRVVEQPATGRHHSLAEVQRVAQPVAGVVRLAEGTHRPGHERLGAESLRITGIQLITDEIVYRDDLRLFLRSHAKPHLDPEEK